MVHCRAAFGYFGVVFAAAFLLGTLRELAIAPNLGEPLAVPIELPFMLAISWFASSWAVNRFNIPAAMSARLIMGSVAFLLLMVAELAISTVALGTTLTQHFDTLLGLSSLPGLAAQFAFALLPAIQLWTGRNALRGANA
jgi:hypothetical protein